MIPVRLVRDRLWLALCLGLPVRPGAAHPPPDLQRDPAPVEGYLDRVSCAPGETLTLRVHALAGSFSYSVLRLGGDERPLAVAEDLPGRPQACPFRAFATGAEWTPTCSFTVPADWPSGLYAVKLKDASAGHAFYMPFVLRGTKGPAQPPVVVMANTFTWQAYNPWGGGSFYKGDHPRAPEDSYETLVSLARPDLAASRNSPGGHTGCAEKHIHTFLMGHGIAYHQIADLDLHQDPSALEGYRLLVIATHSEYWSRQMLDRLEAFLQAGGSVLNLSGNVIWWKVTLRGNQLECRKDRGIHAQTGERGGKWKDLGRPSGPILGVQSDPRGIHTYAPFQVRAADHWLFRGTGVRPGDRIGASGLNEGGASGGEEDKVDALTPPGAVRLAHGLNPGQGGADLVYFRTPWGGEVLSAGSISFCGSLVVDPVLDRLVMNFLGRYRGPRPESGGFDWQAQ
jgi:hypothetical protein